MLKSNILRGDVRLSKLARIVTQYSTEIKKSERVLISGPSIAEPLLLALYRETLRCGAYPTLCVDLPERREIFYQEASEHQLDYCPIEDVFIMENFDVSLKVAADSNLWSLSSVDLTKSSRVQLARRRIRKIEKERIRWNICLFPTNAFAQEAKMSLMEFENFYFAACFADEEDPVSQWRKLRDTQERMVQKLEGAKTLQIIGKNTNLTMSLEGRKICNSWGAVNMPCGEIYTSPLEETVEGVISFSYPAIYNGHEIDGLTLKFKKGQVIEAIAESGQDVINSILDLDSGSRRVGEIGIGTNSRINKFVRNMLLDEKMGGTVHIALGDAYPETLGVNTSAVHLDILMDMKEQGQLLFDDVLIQENGIFTDEFIND